MPWKTPPALVALALIAALALPLAACGGGSTADPVAAATDAAPPSPPVMQDAPPPAASPATAPPAETTPPAATGATPVPAPPARAQRPRPSGGARADSSAADHDEPAPAETTPQVTTTTAVPAEQPEREPATGPAGSLLDERANLVLTRRISPAHYIQEGTVTGTYDGTMEVEARITSRGVLVSFTASLPGGTIAGRGVAVAILDSTTWPGLRGRAIVTGGTGRFAGISGRRLKVTGRAKPDASRAHVRLAGTVYDGPS